MIYWNRRIKWNIPNTIKKCDGLIASGSYQIFPKRFLLYIANKTLKRTDTGIMAHPA